MRLIHNISNEFEIFKTRILPAYGGIPGLDPDQMFAMIAYKNLHLSDFEAIKSGTSKLDRLYDAYRAVVNDQISTLRATITEAEGRLENSILIPAQCTQFGARLTEFLQLSNEVSGRSPIDAGTPCFTTKDGRQRPLSAATSEDFWLQVLDDRQLQTMFAGSNYRMSLGTIAKIIGTDLNAEDFQAESKVAWKAKIGEAQAAIDALRWATLPDVFERTDLTLSGSVGQLSLRGYAAGLLGSPLAIDLLDAGYLDQNFSLYTAQYYGEHVGPRARNFIMHIVERGGHDLEHTFDGDGDIAGMIDELGVEFLATQGAHNIEIFDYVLSLGGEILEAAISGLATAIESDPGFIETYLDRGRYSMSLVNALAPAWDDIFEFIVTRPNPIPLLNSALEHSSVSLSYATSPEVRRQIETAAADLPVLANGATDPWSISEVLQQLGVRIRDLAVLSSRMRSLVIDRSGYRVTRANLIAAIGNTHLALDELEATHPQIHQHVLGHLNEYILALNQFEGDVAVAHTGEFVSVLNTLADASLDDLTAVLERSMDLCRIEDLNAIPAHQWPAVVGTMRCSNTVSNVNTYMRARGKVDDKLAFYLTGAGKLTGADSVAPERRAEIGLEILNANAIHPRDLPRLMQSLDLEAPLSGSLVKRLNGTPVPDLVRDGTLVDDADAFVLAASEGRQVTEQLALVSKTFTEYLPLLGLSVPELEHLIGSSLPERVRIAALGDSDGLQQASAPEARRISRQALKDQLAISPESICALARAGANPSDVLSLLAQAIPGSSDDVMRVLFALPEPYASVPDSSADRPVEIPDDDRPVFDAIKAAGYIYSVKKVQGKPRLKIGRWPGSTVS